MADLNSPKTPTAAPESSAAYSAAPERSAQAESAALEARAREAVGPSQSSAAQGPLRAVLLSLVPLRAVLLSLVPLRAVLLSLVPLRQLLLRLVLRAAQQRLGRALSVRPRPRSARCGARFGPSVWAFVWSRALPRVCHSLS